MPKLKLIVIRNSGDSKKTAEINLSSKQKTLFGESAGSLTQFRRIKGHGLKFSNRVFERFFRLFKEKDARFTIFHAVQNAALAKSNHGAAGSHGFHRYNSKIF